MEKSKINSDELIRILGGEIVYQNGTAIGIQTEEGRLKVEGIKGGKIEVPHVAYIKYQEIEFDNCEFDSFHINQTDTFENITFKNCVLKSSTLAVRCKKLTIVGCEIKDSLVVGYEIDSINIDQINNNISSKSHLTLSITVQYSKSISISATKIKYCSYMFSKAEELKLDNFECEKFDITTTYLSKLIIGSITNTYIWMVGVRCNHIDFNRARIVNSIVKIQDLYLNAISFENVTNDGKVTFKSIRMTNEVSNYYRGQSIHYEGYIGFVASEPRYHELKKPILELSNSDIGKVQFISCDFKDVDFYIDDSNIIEMNYIDFDFPEKINSKLFPDNKNRLLGINNQLKIISEKKKDQNFIFFQKQELNYKYELTNWFYDSDNKALKWPGDKFTLAMMKYSNDFRYRWFRGVVFTTLVGLPFYVPYVIASDTELNLGLSFVEIPWSIRYFLEKYTGEYFEFLNPAHRSDFKKLEDSSAKYLWDMLGRIFVGFGIYQTIQAFRKYGKDV